MKMRDRILHGSFFSSERIGSLSPMARLLYAGMWCLADREGRLPDRPRQLRAMILPYDDIDAGPLLAELCKPPELIRRYEAEEQSYICIPTFTARQKIHRREAESVIPAPPCIASTSTSTSTSEALPPRTRQGKPKADPRQTPISLSRSTWIWSGITDEDHKVWLAACPAVNINLELAKAAAWCRSAGPRGIKSNWRRFLTSWMSRAQDRGPLTTGGRNAMERRGRTVDEVERAEREARS